MKKRKAKLREKIKNRPKTRDSSKKKKKSVTGRPKSLDLDSPMVENTDEGLEVMSNVIWEFAKPLLETCQDEAAERKAISMAIFVWNTALLPEPERKEASKYLPYSLLTSSAPNATCQTSPWHNQRL